MSILIEPPDDWIVAPERWPWPDGAGGGYDHRGDWLASLASRMETEGVPSAALQHAHSVVAMVLERAAVSRLRHYVRFFDRPEAPTRIGAQIAHAELMPAAVLGVQTLEEFAAEADRDQLLAADIDSFRATDGSEGVRAIRTTTFEGSSIAAQVEYLFRHEDEVLIIRSGDLDLVGFQRLLPETDALAASVLTLD